MHTTKLQVQLLAAYMQKSGIHQVVISPGSRNAPLVLEFSENTHFECFSIVDERSAAYFALGLAQQSGLPVAICCTSGSAMANYYPAVTEAFYQNIPLLILSADRPENFVDIFDGQTIRQNHLFAKHSYGNFQLPEVLKLPIPKSLNSQIKQALDACFIHQGPVHINLPFAEPLYEVCQSTAFTDVHYSIPETAEISLDIENLRKKWNAFDRKMILCGMLPEDSVLQTRIYQWAEDENVVILSETTSNLSHPNLISDIDRVLFGIHEDQWNLLAPQALLSIGQNLVSKKIKQLLRKTKLEMHWHVDAYWEADTFFQLTDYFPVSKSDFLAQLYQSQPSNNYFKNWQKIANERRASQNNFLSNTPFSDLKVYEFLSQNLPKKSTLQIANSSAIRYSQLFDFNNFQGIHCNRGTSGIEGSLATALGASLNANHPTIFITGDIGFFYESNSLWNDYIPSNFKIVLVNNQGGEIFNFIQGPDKIPQKNEFLTTQHHRNAAGIASEFDLEYHYSNSMESLESSFQNFINLEKVSILEIDTSGIPNSDYLREFLH